jgi:hypothetical protein
MDSSTTVCLEKNKCFKKHSKLPCFLFYFSMLLCDEMLVCEGVGRMQNKGSEVKCSGKASAIPGVFPYARTHTQVLIPKLKIIFKHKFISKFSGTLFVQKEKYPRSTHCRWDQ